MVSRRSIVEHPFGNLKQWLFGNARFLLRQLEGARAEMALAVNAYKSKHPEQVGAFAGTTISAFSHSLERRVFCGRN
jgi:hypothetical protein